MPNNLSSIGKRTQGKDFNFFQKINVTSPGFAPSPDLIITFPTQGVVFINENNSGIVEYSFNGNTVHGELDPSLPSKSKVFDNRVISIMWWRVKSGSSGPITVSIEAWGMR